MNTWAKWVYSDKKLAVRIFSISYLQKWAGDFAPICHKNAGLACCVVCCNLLVIIAIWLLLQVRSFNTTLV
jgi:hypothetical protein